MGYFFKEKCYFLRNFTKNSTFLHDFYIKECRKGDINSRINQREQGILSV